MHNPPTTQLVSSPSQSEISETSLAYHYVLVPQSPRQAFVAECCAEVLRTTNAVLGSDKYSWEISAPDADDRNTTRSVLVLLGDPAKLWRTDTAGRGALNTAIRHASRLCLVGGAILIWIETGAIASRRLAIPPGLADELVELHPDLENSQTALCHRRHVSSAVGPAAALRMIVDLVSATEGYPTGRAVAQIIGLVDPTSPEHMKPQLREVDGDPVLTDAVSVMLDHIEDTVSIRQVAALIGASPRHLERKFRERTARSPANYYRDIRLDHARNLISWGNFTLPEVAVASGFSCARHMRNWYRRRFGEAPEATVHRVRRGVRPHG